MRNPQLRSLLRTLQAAGILAALVCGLSIGAVAQPANDDVLNATPLTVNVPFVFDNVGATVEAGEPNPGPGTGGLGCNAQDGWCNIAPEPVVDNSVWFTFVAPALPVTIGTVAADLQIALWDVGDPSIFATFTEVAANDDSGPVFFAPLITPIILVPGATYYVQVDGYAGLVAAGQKVLVSTEPLDESQDLAWLATNTPVTFEVAAVAGAINDTFGDLEFGLYDPADPDSRIPIFQGGISVGDVNSFSPSGPFGFYVSNVGTSLEGPYTFFSDSSLNPGIAGLPPRLDAMAARVVGAGFYSIAFEDRFLPLIPGLSDITVVVGMIQPIPCPCFDLGALSQPPLYGTCRAYGPWSGGYTQYLGWPNFSGQTAVNGCWFSSPFAPGIYSRVTPAEHRVCRQTLLTAAANAGVNCLIW